MVSVRLICARLSPCAQDGVRHNTLDTGVATTDII
jgi:hypothetical protein